MEIQMREFYHRTSAVAKTAEREPVVVTRDGAPALVLMTYREYENLTRSGRTIGDALADPDATGDFAPERYRGAPNPAAFE